MWHHPIGVEVTGLQPTLAVYWSASGHRRIMATATMAFIPNGNIVISYGQVEIPSVESSDMSSNMAQAQAEAGYGEKSWRSHGSTFFQ